MARIASVNLSIHCRMSASSVARCVATSFILLPPSSKLLALNALYRDSLVVFEGDASQKGFCRKGRRDSNKTSWFKIKCNYYQHEVKLRSSMSSGSAN